MDTKLKGKLVVITDKESPYYNEWGIVEYFDGEYYGIAIAGDKSSIPIFCREEFRIRRKDFRVTD